MLFVILASVKPIGEFESGRLRGKPMRPDELPQGDEAGACEMGAAYDRNHTT